MRVLVTEDCSDARSTLVDVFRSLGHEAIAAADGAQAIQLAIQHGPHLAF